MSQILTLELPYPPSVNTYWRHPGRGRLAGRHLISRKGREYRTQVGWLLRSQRAGSEPLQGRLDVTINAQPPDNRRRDIDNILKAIFDACTHGGFWLDDSQIKRLTACWMPPCTGGAVTMHVKEIELEGE